MTNQLPPMPDTPPPVVPKPTATKRRTLILAAAVAGALAVGGSVYWISRPSYDDIVKGCQRALVAQYQADGRGKPSACDGVKGDDYDVLVVNAAMGDLGWLDDDGDFDKDKVLEGTLDQP
ncbi:hypothetical protein OG410_07985 [Streptomyces sp. NBC_00659]|uniref:hypothetical protein n=1 Tax=Streptomyces sp. NBC_00659 TaxID=2903669 RepID=UPI002E2EAAF2|nr:hypothetical protein [Streptomyces sp. NBC_00659]